MKQKFPKAEETLPTNVSVTEKRVRPALKHDGGTKLVMGTKVSSSKVKK